MAVEQAIYDDGLSTAGADLSAKQFLGVLQSTTVDNQVTVATVQGAPILGILQNKPTSGQPATVRILGRTKCVAGASITRGARVMMNASGQVITGATAGSTTIGWATESAVVNQLVSVILIPYSGTI